MALTIQQRKAKAEKRVRLVRVGFSPSELVEVQYFADQVNLSIEKFSKQAIFYAMNDAVQRTEAFEAVQKERKLQESIDAQHNTEAGDSEGAVVEGGQNSGSPSLPNQEAYADSQG